MIFLYFKPDLKTGRSYFQVVEATKEYFISYTTEDFLQEGKRNGLIRVKATEDEFVSYSINPFLQVAKSGVPLYEAKTGHAILKDDYSTPCEYLPQLKNLVAFGKIPETKTISIILKNGLDKIYYRDFTTLGEYQVEKIDEFESYVKLSFEYLNLFRVFENEREVLKALDEYLVNKPIFQEGLNKYEYLALANFFETERIL